MIYSFCSFILLSIFSSVVIQAADVLPFNRGKSALKSCEKFFQTTRSERSIVLNFREEQETTNPLPERYQEAFANNPLWALFDAWNIILKNDISEIAPSRSDVFGTEEVNYRVVFSKPNPESEYKIKINLEPSIRQFVSDPNFDLFSFLSQSPHGFHWMSSGLNKTAIYAKDKALMQISSNGETLEFSPTKITSVDFIDTTRVIENLRAWAPRSWKVRDLKKYLRFTPLESGKGLTLTFENPTSEAIPENIKDLALVKRQLEVEYRLASDVDSVRAQIDLITDIAGLSVRRNLQDTLAYYYSSLKPGGYLFLWLPLERLPMDSHKKQTSQLLFSFLGDSSPAGNIVLFFKNLPGFELVNSFEIIRHYQSLDGFSTAGLPQRLYRGQTLILRKSLDRSQNIDFSQIRESTIDNVRNVRLLGLANTN